MSTPIFGRVITRQQVAQAALATLREWLVFHLADVERQEQRRARSLAPPKSWATAVELDSTDEAKLPRIVVACPGLAGDPDLHADGKYGASFAIAAGAFVSASSFAAAEALAGSYTAAIREALIKHPTLGGLASGLDWTDENYTPVRADRNRIVASGEAAFVAHIDDVATSSPVGLPATPPADPYAPPAATPTVETTHLIVTREEITAP